VFVGRDPRCAIEMSDPLVSRRHARLWVEDGSLFVEDLGSRNGVSVNGLRIQRPTHLLPGDAVLIGDEEIRVARDQPRGELTTTQKQIVTQKSLSIGVVADLAVKAFALGRNDEAERLLSTPLAQLVSDARDGGATDEATWLRATSLALRLLTTTRRGRWLDWLVEAYGLLGRPWPAETIDELYRSGRHATGYDRESLRRYCRLLRQREQELGPAERFLIGRIEGLERLFSAQ